MRDSITLSYWAISTTHPLSHHTLVQTANSINIKRPPGHRNVKYKLKHFNAVDEPAASTNRNQSCQLFIEGIGQIGEAMAKVSAVSQ